MKILLSNDDGIYAQGLRTLALSLATIADLEVMAPDRNRSGASNSLTLYNPLRVKTIEAHWHAVEGTPTDCVHLGLTGFLSESMDMVVSGINHGANLGDDILYSGTVAAAMEGRYLGLPALALSLVGDRHFDTAAAIALQLVQRLSQQTLPAKTILNVNVPDRPLADIRGLQVTRLGSRHVAAKTIAEKDPRGLPMYWIGPAGPESDAGPGTDFHALQQGYVSVTPLQLDMTQYGLFDSLSHCLEGIGC